jgi:hypothetical protein
MALTKGYLANFKTLSKAFANKDAGLVECTDVETGKPVMVICAFSHYSATGEVTTVPLAKLFDGNPYKELVPPTMEEVPV